jgi:hypothetical protein
MSASQPRVIEEVVIDGALRAIIVRREFSRPGVSFVTPNDFSQQLGYMAHPAGHQIQPHVHNEVVRDVRPTQEVLIIRKGALRVDLYADGRVRRESRTLQAGDVILLASGGHGFEILDDCEMIEVKPGPYAEGEDKIRFVPDNEPLVHEG